MLKLILVCLGLILCSATPSKAVTYIYDCWWSGQVDLDGDGFCSSGTLNIDADCNSGGAYVYAKIYARLTGGPTWNLVVTTPQFYIYGTSSSDYMSVNFPGSGPALLYDYRVELYLTGIYGYIDYSDPYYDASLGAHPEEGPSYEIPATATIYDAWWSNATDLDGDGAPSSSRLNWDADVVGNGSLSVYERIYHRPHSGGSWTLFATTTPHTISGASTLDSVSILVEGKGNGESYDYRIEVYRAGLSQPDAAVDATNDPNLNGHREESLLADRIAFLYDVWFTDPQDPDGDQCVSSARLNWDADVLGGGGSMTVYEKIYYRQVGTSSWILHTTTASHVISGDSEADAVSILLPGVGSCALYEGRVEIYQSGRTTFDDYSTPTEDSDLGNLRMEAPDVVAPTISLTAPAAGQRLLSLPVIISGSAGDNEGLARIELRHEEVDPANTWRTATGLATWSHELTTIQPGTNRVSVRAVDRYGNTSTVLTRSFVYVLTSPLQLVVEGGGTVSPLHDGELLELGKSYSVTATPGPGSSFGGWRVDTAGGSQIVTSGTISFTMEQGLVLTAKFNDIQRPTLAITSPTSKQNVSNAVVVVRGNASDNVGVTRVWVQPNQGPWQAAEGTANWSCSLVALPGTNDCAVCSVDAAGNYSLTNRVTFVYVVSDVLKLQVTGSGTISPNHSNAFLQVGKSYTLLATPASGYMFSNWVGSTSSEFSVLSTTSKLDFVMRSNLCLQANFVQNPFVALKGTYVGLCSNPTNPTTASAGYVNLTVTDRGLYTGSLIQGGKKISLSGSFDVSGRTTKAIAARPPTPAISIELQLNLDPSMEQVNGTLQAGQSFSQITALKSVFSATVNPATRLAGSYTLILPGTEADDPLGVGHGYGALTVATSGSVTFAGTLADGTAIKQTTFVSRNGLCPFFAPLYTGKGAIQGWLGFNSDTPASSLAGAVRWIRDPQPAAKLYAGGFTNLLEAEGMRFTPRLTGTRIINLDAGVVAFDGGNLSSPFKNEVRLGVDNRVSNLSSNRIALTIVPKTGLFSGSVTVPGKTTSLVFKGALLQGADLGYGYFLGTNQSGRVYFGVPVE